jgi:toxin ParE1/3/4
MQNGDIVRVKWLRRALSDLDAEVRYIAQDNPELAVQIYAYVRERVAGLETFPESGRPGRVFGTRELVIGRYSYLVPYRIKNETVEILRIFHARRKLPKTWK